MNKTNNGKKYKTGKSLRSNHLSEEFKIFKSRVANALLQFIESGTDTELMKRLDKANSFLINTSDQMEKIFSFNKSAYSEQSELFEIADDLFNSERVPSSNSIH